MPFRKMLFKFTYREDKNSSIPTLYIFNFALQLGINLLRGRIKGIGINNKNNFFCGRGTKFFWKKNLFFGDKVNIGRNCIIDSLSRDGVHLGNSSKLGDGCVIRCSTIQHLGDGLFIGNGSCFDAECFFGASGKITIGDNVIAGRGIKFHAENHNYSEACVPIKEQGVTSLGISIGNDCWIGSNVIFLDGAVIGNGCVVAAGAVVRGSYGNNVVIGGIPAKKIKDRLV